MKTEEFKINMKTFEDGLTLSPKGIEETRLYNWIYFKKKANFNESDLAKMFGVTIAIINHWNNGMYSYKHIKIISEITSIPEWDLVIDRYCMDKYKKIYSQKQEVTNDRKYKKRN